MAHSLKLGSNMGSNRPIRTPIILAVEGDSEQSFIKWLQKLANDKKLNIHLDCKNLCGGGYESMLKGAIDYRERKQSNPTHTILLIDSDRADRHEDEWTLNELQQEAAKESIHVCIQMPKHEAWLLRLLSKKKNPSMKNIDDQLRKAWKNYQKPADANTLANKFSYNSLRNVAQAEKELESLLKIIGLL